MNRSTGVTISVVIAILGSLLSLVFGGLLILTSATTSTDQPLPDWQPAPPVSVPVILLFEGIGAIGIGMIGLAFAIALFKLHNWARIGFIVFASILCFFAVMTALVSALIGLAGGQFMPQNQEIPPGIIAFTVALMLGMALILGVLGTSWLIFFTRAAVKAQFKGEGVSVPFFWFGIIMGSIATVVPLWLLIRRRKSFLEACRLPVLP
jgi:hypothetical protein